MAEVTLSIGGRAFPVACRDGEEARLTALGRAIDARWAMAARAAGQASGERPMLYAALMLADALDEVQNRPPSPGTVAEPALVRIAERLEALADALEQSPPAA